MFLHEKGTLNNIMSCTVCSYIPYSANFSKSLTFACFKNECWSKKFVQCEKLVHCLVGMYIAAEKQTPKIIAVNMSKMANHEMYNDH